MLLSDAAVILIGWTLCAKYDAQLADGATLADGFGRGDINGADLGEGR